MTTTTTNTDQVRANCQLLLESGNESAELCAQDALACLTRHNLGDLFPGQAQTDRLPQTWHEAAEKWAEAGAEHAWGWERNRPQGWQVTRWSRG